MTNKEINRDERLIRLAVKFAQLSPEQKKIIISMMENALRKEGRSA